MHLLKALTHKRLIKSPKMINSALSHWNSKWKLRKQKIVAIIQRPKLYSKLSFYCSNTKYKKKIFRALSTKKCLHLWMMSFCNALPCVYLFTHEKWTVILSFSSERVETFSPGKVKFAYNQWKHISTDNW